MPAIPWLPAATPRPGLAAGRAGSLAVPRLRVGPARSVFLEERSRAEAAEAGAAEGPGLEAPPADYLWARLRAALQPPLPLSLASNGTLDWPHELMPFQLQGVRLLFESDRLLLADEMGLGKTVQALAALRLLVHRDAVQGSLVVTPAGVFAQWRDQFARWAPELRLSPVRGAPGERAAQWNVPAHAHLVTYETLRADLSMARRRVWDLVIIDEAQKIKNAGTDVAIAVKRLRRRRAWALTGTPLENDVDDLASILEFVRPRTEDAIVAPIRPGPQLRAALSEVQVRRRKRDVLTQLPPKTQSELLLPMTPEQRRAYDLAENEGLVQLRALGAAIQVANVLELIVRLKQICNFDPGSGASAKMEDLSGRIAQLAAGGERALVFSQFTDGTFGVGAIVRRLAAYEPLALTGDLSLAQREQVLRSFRSDPRHRVLVLSLRAGGVGLNLQEASYVFHFDRWWNPAVEDQASDRSHRLGQALPVHVYAYALERSVEERVVEVLREKRVLFAEIVEGAGIHVETGLGREELFRVVGLTARRSV